MSEKTDGSSGFNRKKYLYLDKFETFKEEYRACKVSINERMKKFENRMDGIIWIVIFGSCLAMAALLISVLK